MRSYDIAGLQKDSPRFLIDRLWPRGLKKEVLELDLWAKELSPSSELRKWYHQDAENRQLDPKKWVIFKKRYFKELDEKKAEVGAFIDLIRRYKKITLIYSSAERDANNAAALKEYLAKRL